jgi:glycosyltransferase involved in cell wall biosynthesis
MRVAIICGHFVPAMGYVEVHLAKAFQELGHSVKVITSNKKSSSTRNLSIEQNEKQLEYEVARLKPWFSFGQIVKANGIEEELMRFNPDKVFVIGLGKLFPKEVFRMKNRKFELITLLGDNEDTYNTSSSNVKRWVLQKLLKTPVYELAIKESDRLIGYTPSTKGIVNAFIKKEFKPILAQKYTESTLGYDDDEFYYSTNKRAELRAQLGISSDEMILVTATRVNKTKQLEKIIDTIELIAKNGTKFRYVIIGFSNDEYCRELKKYIRSKNLEQVVLTLPFMPRKEMVDYFNMADLGLWTQAAISIFEALGTGLFLLLPQKKNVSHILTKSTGDYFLEANLMNKLAEYINSIPGNREENEVASKTHFSFKVIAKNLLNNDI